jgi:DNA-binding CsgD family transcriptional regulator
MSDEERVRTITELEEQIIELLRSGLRNAEIADELDLTMRQVRVRIGALLGDLGLPDRDALVGWRERYPPPPLAVRITYRRSGLRLGDRARRLLERFQSRTA